MKLYSKKTFKNLVRKEAKEVENFGGDFKKIIGWFNLALGEHKAARKMDLLRYTEVFKNN